MGNGYITGIIMATDFDEFPLYDPLIKRGTDKMSAVWQDFIATFYMNLIGYLSQNGIFLPKLTSVQRDQITSPQNSQMIYNTTTDAPQIYQNGAWKTFTTT